MPSPAVVGQCCTTDASCRCDESVACLHLPSRIRMPSLFGSLPARHLRDRTELASPYAILTCAGKCLQSYLECSSLLIHSLVRSCRCHPAISSHYSPIRTRSYNGRLTMQGKMNMALFFHEPCCHLTFITDVLQSTKHLHQHRILTAIKNSNSCSTLAFEFETHTRRPRLLLRATLTVLLLMNSRVCT